MIDTLKMILLRYFFQPFAGLVLSKAALEVAHAKGWYPEQQLASIIIASPQVLQIEWFRWCLLAALTIIFWTVADYFFYRRNAKAKSIAPELPTNNDLVSNISSNKELKDSLAKMVAASETMVMKLMGLSAQAHHEQKTAKVDIPIYRARRGQVQHDMYTDGKTIKLGDDTANFTLRVSPASTECIHMYKDQLDYLARVRGRNAGDILKIQDYPGAASSFTIAVGERFLGMNKFGQMIQGKIVDIKYDGRGAEHHEVTFDYVIGPIRGGDFTAI
jgi:hypothetical protein